MLILDEHCKFKTAQVVDPYDCTLNQTDLKTNKNKFYIMQVIKNGNDHYIYIRYGRIGEVGKISYTSGALNSCVSKFITQFKSKTKNSWDSRNNFQQYPDKYYLCQKQEVKEEAVVDDTGKTKEKPKSNLDQRVQSFLELVGNLEMLQTTLKSLDIDTAKMPLGAIKSEQLEKAEQILAEIQKELSAAVANAATTTGTSTAISNTKLTDLSSKYYTYVPQVVSRSQKPQLINTEEIVKKYSDKIEDLKNLKIAYTTLESSANSTMHPADDLYGKVKTEIKPVDRDSETWKVIQAYVTNTHGSTHHIKVQLQDIYEITRDDEKERGEYLDQIGNVHLLWHGTRLSNYISILQHGLVLRPELISDAKICGKMFGYGIYTANSFSKSVNYCASYRGEEACLFLAEVALGNPIKKINADYHLNYKGLKSQGYDSCWGQGKYTPESQSKLKLLDGNREIIVPNGKLGQSTLPNPALLYDEFIVYNQEQIRLKYIVRVKNI